MEMGDRVWRRRGVPFENEFDVVAYCVGCDGEGDRDRFRVIDGIGSDGVDGLVKPLLIPTAFWGRLSDSETRCVNAPFTCPCKLGNPGLFELVNSLVDVIAGVLCLEPERETVRTAGRLAMLHLSRST